MKGEEPPLPPAIQLYPGTQSAVLPETFPARDWGFLACVIQAVLVGTPFVTLKNCAKNAWWGGGYCAR